MNIETNKARDNEIANQLISNISKLIEPINKQYKVSDLTLRRCLTEAWFSNTLSWLLDTQADHGLGISFAKAFLKKIAEKRSANDYYARETYHLKKGKEGIGHTVQGIKLANSTTIREFYLSGEIKRNGRKQKYCDIVLLDLDADDDLFVAIENKLFTNNHSEQLQDYFKIIQDKYHNKNNHKNRFEFQTMINIKSI